MIILLVFIVVCFCCIIDSAIKYQNYSFSESSLRGALATWQSSDLEIIDKRKINFQFPVFIFLLLFSLISIPLYSHPAFDVQSALSSLEQGDLDKAESDLQKARFEEPDSFIINYDLGIVSYRKRDYAKSIRYFARASELCKTPDERFDAFYNMGNAAFKAYDFALAVTAYKNALAVKNDFQADYNLKVAEKKLQEMLERMKKEQEQQNQQDQQNQQGQQDKKDNKKSNSNKSDKNKQQNKDKQSQQGEPNKDQQENQDNQQNQEQQNSQSDSSQSNEENSQNGQQQNSENNERQPIPNQDEQNKEQQSSQQSEGSDDKENQENQQSGESNKEQKDKEQEGEKEQSAKASEDDSKEEQQNAENGENKEGNEKQASNSENKESDEKKDEEAKAVTNEETQAPEEDRRDVKMAEDKGKVSRPEASQKARAMKNIRLNKKDVEEYLKQMEAQEAERQKYYRINNIEEKDPAYMNQEELREWMKVRNRKRERARTNQQDW